MTGTTLTARDVARLLWETIVRPAETARTILAMHPPREALWLGVALVSVLSVLLVALLEALAPAAPEAAAGGAGISPFVYGLILAASLVFSVVALQMAGRALGGAGRFDQALALMVWLQFLLVALQAAQILLVLLIPLFGALLALASVAIMVWCLVHFVDVLHGFGSIGKSLLTLLLAFMGLGLAVALVLLVAGGGVAEQV